MLLCENNSYYTGYTNDLERRYEEHCRGTGACKYTRAFKPVCIAQSWVVASKCVAMKMEYYIKRQSRVDKERFTRDPAVLLKQFNFFYP